MSMNDAPTAGVSEEDAAMLARAAGLIIPSERLPRFATDLAVIRALVADLSTVSTDGVPPVPGPFDPAWTERVR